MGLHIDKMLRISMREHKFVKQTAKSFIKISYVYKNKVISKFSKNKKKILIITSLLISFHTSRNFIQCFNPLTSWHCVLRTINIKSKTCFKSTNKIMRRQFNKLFCNQSITVLNLTKMQSFLYLYS